MPAFTESLVEDAALSWLSDLGYAIAHGPNLAPSEPASERATFADVLLLARLNPRLPPEALDDALRKVTHPESPSLVENNGRFHRLLVEGVDVEFQRGAARPGLVRI
jgi:type I restriction enzyme, R subunit